jgi:hypothetical protein
MKACALANAWLMNSLWKLVRSRTIGSYESLMHSQTIGLWIAYESLCACTWCLRQMWHECDTWHIACHQLALMDELCLLVCVLLCLFLSWRATSKVVQCWTKRLTYCCVKHKKFRLTAPRPQVPQESMHSPYYFGAWGVLYDAMW